MSARNQRHREGAFATACPTPIVDQQSVSDPKANSSDGLEIERVGRSEAEDKLTLPLRTGIVRLPRHRQRSEIGIVQRRIDPTSTTAGKVRSNEVGSG